VADKLSGQCCGLAKALDLRETCDMINWFLHRRLNAFGRALRLRHEVTPADCSNCSTSTATRSCATSVRRAWASIGGTCRLRRGSPPN
jgi:hypothetical protein